MKSEPNRFYDRELHIRLSGLAVMLSHQAERLTRMAEVYDGETERETHNARKMGKALEKAVQATEPF